MDPKRKDQVKQLSSADQQAAFQDPEHKFGTYERVWAILDAITDTPTLTVDEIANRTIDAAQREFDFKHLSLLLVNRERDVLELVGNDPKTNPTRDGKPTELDLRQGLVGWVVEHGTALRIGDVLQDSRHTTLDNPWPPDTRSTLIVPLKIKERVIGTINATSPTADAFSDAAEYLLTTIARQLAVALENARRYQETEKRLAEVSALYQLAQQINASLNIQDVLDSIVWSLKQALECRGCSIALLDPDTNLLEIRTAAGVASKWARDFRLGLGEGIAGRVALEGKPIYVPNTVEQKDFIFFDPSVRSLLTVPLTLQQRIIGTLTVDSDRAFAFSESDERLLTITATQAAIAIENAQLYASLEQRAQNLAEAYAELKKADRLKDEIVQNVSHELRTPLTFVKGYVELLLDENAGPLNTLQKEYLTIVAEKADVVTQLVSDIMAIQKAEQVPIKREPVSLNEVARQAIRGCAGAAERAGLTLIENLPDNLLSASGDRSKLLQVFDNLLGNAIKFSPEGGQVVVTIKDTETKIQASVSDQGIGIPKDQHELIFERFYQVDGSARRHYGGAGLGLAIVKRIVEAHEGEAWVESELGRGSTFYITIPKHHDPFDQ
jgi:signal transduction histidine kinase